MEILKKKGAPTLEERLTGAETQAAAALSVFELAAADLSAAAAEAEEVQEAALSEVDRLAIVAREAEHAAERSRAKAARIRALVDGEEV